MIPIGNFIQKLSVKTQLETANFSGLLGRVLSDIRLVKLQIMKKKKLQMQIET